MFVVREQLFKQLLAGAQSGKHNLDFVIRRLRQANHIVRKVDYLYRLAHVEHEYFTTQTHGASL